MKYKTKERIFFLAAIWNLVFGLAMLLFPAAVFSLFYGETLLESAYLLRLFSNCFAFSILIFGMGYFLVSRNPNENHAVIWMGIVGKVAVFGIFLLGLIDGRVTPYGFFGAAGDLVWAAIFLAALRQTRRGNERLTDF